MLRVQTLQANSGGEGKQVEVENAVPSNNVGKKTVIKYKFGIFNQIRIFPTDH
jgi:hypothetical protein